MPQFLTTSGTSHLIEDIIIKANSELVLITPYLKLSRILFERLTEANHRGVRIRLVYGKSELHHNERNQLDALTNIELLFLENLHAKCYFNDKTLIVSSMNLYEFSEKNNREMGIVLTRRDDEECFADALAEAQSIIAAAQVVSVRKIVVDTRSHIAVDHRNMTKELTVEKNTQEAPQEKAEYDSARMVKLLHKLLTQQPGLDNVFTLETTPSFFNSDNLTATISAENYPRQGIHFKFSRDIRFDFDERADYREVKRTQRDEVNQLLEGCYRCYWNQDVIQIYAASSYERVDEQATAEYFLKAVVNISGVLQTLTFAHSNS